MQIVVEIDITGISEVKPRTKKNRENIIQESETKLLITITAKNYSTGKLFADEISCSIPLPSENFRAKNLDWRKEYAKWFKGIDTLIESTPHESDKNPTIAVSEECQKIGSESISHFNEWISYQNEIRAALLAVIPINTYKQNPDAFRFILRTRTGDSDLDLELQRFPYHTWEFLRNSYPHAEIARNMSNHTLSDVVSHQRPQILVILGYDPKINFIPHQESIAKNIPDNFEVKYWSCEPGNPNTGLFDPEPIPDLFATLKANSPEVVIFIGHSRSTELSSTDESVDNASVEIRLDNKNSISLEDLNVQEILKGLGTRGTIFAAFISCDGQRIAPIVNTLGIPCVMVSIEILPVHIAKILLAKFLEEATKPGVPIHIALSYARQHLQYTVEHSRIEGCPNASNFPVIFQIPDRHSYILNPIPEPETVTGQNTEQGTETESTIWQTLIQDINKLRKTLFGKILGFIFISSLGLILALTWALTHPPGKSDSAKIPPSPTTEKTRTIIPKSIQDNPNISLGEKPLLTDYKDITNPFKEIGFKEFGEGNYTEAKLKFNTYLLKHKNYPEILIAINNSIAAENAAKYSKPNNSLEPLRIAVGVPFLKNPTVAREILAGIAMYQQKINGGGGRLQIVIGQDENTEKSAKAIATEFVKELSILGVIGHNASAASLPAAGVYSPGHLVMLNPTAFDTRLEGQPYIYRMVPNLDFFAAQIKEEINKIPKSRIATCVDLLAPDNEKFKKIFGDVTEVSKMITIPLPCENFQDIIKDPNRIQVIIKKIRDSKSNAILVSPHVDSIGIAIDLLKAIRNEPELSNLRLFGTSSFYTHAAEGAGIGKNKVGIDGLTVPVPYFPDSKNMFFNEYKKQWGEDLNNWRTSMAYASTEVLYAALQQTPTREGLNDILSTKEFASTVIGKFRFDRKSHDLEYSSKTSLKGVMIELYNKKFRLLKNLI